MSIQSCQIYIKPLYTIHYNYCRFLSSSVSYKIHIAAVCFCGEYKLCRYTLPDKLCNSLVTIQALHQRRGPVQCSNSAETLHSLWTLYDLLQNILTIQTVRTSKIVIILPSFPTALTGPVNSRHWISQNMHFAIPVVVEIPFNKNKWKTKIVSKTNFLITTKPPTKWSVGRKYYWYGTSWVVL